MAAKSARLLVWLIAVTSVILIGLSRVAGGEHFFSDVMAGWFLGYSLFVAVAVWYELREKKFKKLMEENVD